MRWAVGRRHTHSETGRKTWSGLDRWLSGGSLTDSRPDPWTITGGTGAYDEAEGQLTLQPTNDTDVRITFDID